jgi:uncharacterized membrane protein YczE
VIARRLIQLYVGLALFGLSMTMMVHGRLGLDPWDVFHQGLAPHLHVRFGTCSIIVGVFVLLAWIPLRQRPGFGTLSNVLVVGLVVNATMPIVPHPAGLTARFALLAGGIVLNGVATGCYIGAGLGPGPRDGLMTGIARRGHSLRLARTSIELTVLAAGFLLGGSVGVGTVAYAVTIGPLAHIAIPFFTIVRPEEAPSAALPEPALPEPDAA